MTAHIMMFSLFAFPERSGPLGMQTAFLRWAQMKNNAPKNAAHRDYHARLNAATYWKVPDSGTFYHSLETLWKQKLPVKGASQDSLTLTICMLLFRRKIFCFGNMRL